MRARRRLRPARALRTERGGLRLWRYRSLFSGAGVERVPELQFQRPPAELELSLADARERGVGNGDRVRAGSNGTARELTVKVNRRLLAGVVRIAEEHAQGFEDGLEVSPVER